LKKLAGYKLYIISFTIGFFLVFLVIFSNDFLSLDLADKFRVLTDAFTIPGFLFLGVGVLMLISSTGTYDGLMHVLDHLKRSLLPFLHYGSEEKSFYEFKKEREEKRKEKIEGRNFILKTGIIFILISLVFLALFYYFEGKS